VFSPGQRSEISEYAYNFHVEDAGPGRGQNNGYIGSMYRLWFLAPLEQKLIDICIDSATVLCKSAEGYWCDFSAPSKGTKLIKEQLKTDPTLENL
jgi:hypothetical protein